MQIYRLGSGDRVSSELRTRAESVLWANVPNVSFIVELELERPGSSRYLPPHGIHLAIPQVASAPAPPAVKTAPTPQPAQNTGEPVSESGASDEAKLIGTMRSATQEEEGQVLWRRWPN